MRRTGVLMLGAWLGLSPPILSGAAEPPAPLPAAPPAAAAPSDTTPSPPPYKAQSSDYVIGPGDTLQVFVWRNPELSVSVPVRPDGKISTPLVEDMVAVGKTPPQLARDMERVLAEYVRSPKVNIIVTTAASAFSLVKVVGQVTHPQAVPYREGMTVLDAILVVGGLTPFAAGNRARIVRLQDGHETVIHVKVADIVNNGDVHDNVPLKPGDVLVVPQSLF
jgi:polysaccharide export outer membrane protein